MEPLVSVIIPNYNHSLFLKDRIDSVINQKFNDFEVIILDDCSTDDSRKIIESYRSNPIVKQIIFNETNSGSTFKQWNKGVTLANGKYIWIAESDDIADENFLGELIRPFLDNSKVVLCFCQSYRMDKENNVTGTWESFMKSTNSKLFDNEFTISGKEFIENSLLYKNTIPNASSLIFKKSIYEEIGGADEHLKYCSDWLTWLKMATLGDVSFNENKLNYFRYHQQSVIGKTGSSKDLFFKRYDIELRVKFNKYLNNKYTEYKNVIACNNQLLKAEKQIELIAENIVRRKYCLVVKHLIFCLLKKHIDIGLMKGIIIKSKNYLTN